MQVHVNEHDVQVGDILMDDVGDVAVVSQINPVRLGIIASDEDEKWSWLASPVILLARDKRPVQQAPVVSSEEIDVTIQSIWTSIQRTAT